MLLILCTDEATARWAVRCGDLGGSVVLKPVIVGPSAVPVITDPDIARADLEMAMLSAFVHPDEHRVLDAVFAALSPDDDRRQVERRTREPRSVSRRPRRGRRGWPLW